MPQKFFDFRLERTRVGLAKQESLAGYVTKRSENTHATFFHLAPAGRRALKNNAGETRKCRLIGGLFTWRCKTRIQYAMVAKTVKAARRKIHPSVLITCLARSARQSAALGCARTV